MKNQNILVALCLLLSSGLTVSADPLTDNARPPASSPAAPTAEGQATYKLGLGGFQFQPYARKQAAWTSLLQNAKACISKLTSLQQKADGGTAVPEKLQDARIRLNIVVRVAEQQLEDLQEDTQNWSIQTPFDINKAKQRFIGSSRAAHSSVDQLQAVQLLVGQIPDGELPKAGVSSLEDELNIALDSARTVLRFFESTHKTPAQREAFLDQLNRERQETARFLAQYDSKEKARKAADAQQEREIAKTLQEDKALIKKLNDRAAQKSRSR